MNSLRNPRGTTDPVYGCRLPQLLTQILGAALLAGVALPAIPSAARADETANPPLVAPAPREAGKADPVKADDTEKKDDNGVMRPAPAAPDVTPPAPADVTPPAPADVTPPKPATPPADVTPPKPEPPAAVLPNFRVRPTVASDPQRLRRTVHIDGILGDGEWDTFYAVKEGPVTGVFYCNWDENYLYLAARTNAPATVIFDVDALGDGWLRGADNMEIVVGDVKSGASPNVIARLLDASSSKDAATWNEKAVNPDKFMAAGRLTGDVQVIEIAIPRDTAGLTLRADQTLGLRAEFIAAVTPSAYVPTQPFEPHLLIDAKLVEARTQPAAGINPRLTLADAKVIPGQVLQANFDLLNQTDVPVAIRSITWTGVGASAEILNTLHEVNVAPLPGMKQVRYKFTSKLPEDVISGSYMMRATAELANGKTVASETTFKVVEALSAQITSTPDPIAVVGPTKLGIVFDIVSAVPDHLRGDIEITALPAGWDVEGGRKRGIYVDREDGRITPRFNVKVPSNTPAGDYPFEGTVTWHNKVWKVRTVAHAVRPDVAPTPAPAPAPTVAPAPTTP